MKCTTKSGASGFSLVEVAIATAIIGIGLTALMVSVGAGTRTNAAGGDLTQGLFLAGEVREYLVKQPFNTVAGLGTVTWSPPRDAQGNAIAGKTDWSQVVTVTYRNPANLTAVSGTPTDIVRVDVSVCDKNVVVSTTNFVIARSGP